MLLIILCKINELCFLRQAIYLRNWASRYNKSLLGLCVALKTRYMRAPILFASHSAFYAVGEAI